MTVKDLINFLAALPEGTQVEIERAIHTDLGVEWMIEALEFSDLKVYDGILGIS